MGPRPMAMRLLVPPHGKLRDVGEHGSPGHVDIHVARSLTPLVPGNQVDLPDVGNEVGVQDPAIVFRVVFSLFGEKILYFGVETVLEHVIGVEDKLRVTVELEGHRRAGQGNVSGRFTAAGVEVLMPCVKGNGKEASSFPFEGPFREAVIPNSRGAPAGSDQDDLLIELPSGLEAPTGRDLAHVAIADWLLGQAP